MHNEDVAQEIFRKPSDFGENDDEVALEGRIILEHLENVNMDAWDYIYQVYVNPQGIKK